MSDAYNTALSGAVVVDESGRGLARVHGRDPVRMVHGLVSNDVASLVPGHAQYATMLTPKGRLVADLRVIRRTADVWIEADSAALSNIIDVFTRSVPPLFARIEDLRSSHCVLGLFGPAATDIIAAVVEDPGDASGSGAWSDVLGGVAVDDSAIGSFRGTEVALLRTARSGVAGWDIVVACNEKDALRDALLAGGAAEGEAASLEVLRVEAGEPRWGAELTGDVIPLEAGLETRAISTTKGCYTGQEVIIRIVHRGHVNRRLRGLRFDGRLPAGVAPGAELFHTEIRPGKPVGLVTSAVESPRLGGLALGYVRREVEPGARVRVGGTAGPAATVVELPFRSSS